MNKLRMALDFSEWIYIIRKEINISFKLNMHIFVNMVKEPHLQLKLQAC